jgi:phosphatidylserine/phosphatidylglycerophosphate/cardiolipin synthase-like enzyme
MLAGIAGMGADGRRKPVYVHAKLMLVDDEWATVGSCNLHHFSLFGNGEMNVTFSEPTPFARFVASFCANTSIRIRSASMIAVRSICFERSPERTEKSSKPVNIPGKGSHSSSI